MHRLLALLVVVSACKKAPEPVVCSEQASVLPETPFTVDATPFEFTWSDEAGVSVGPTFEFVLPADLVSFSATVDAPGQYTGFGELAYLDQVWIDATALDGPSAWEAPPWFHWGALGGTITAPIDVASDPTGARCLRIQAAALDDIEGTSGTLRLAVRSGAIDDPVIDLNVAVVGDTQIAQADLDAAMLVATSTWRGGGGPSVGSVRVYSVPGPTLLPYDDSPALRATVIDLDRTQAVNLFLVQDYLDEAGTLGEAGGIPGPIALQGIEEAGVILSVDAHLTFDGVLDTVLLGEVIAHEVGHQLGLFHTTEDDGTRTQPLTDVPVCPASADVDGDGSFDAEECRAWDGANFMFWAAADFEQHEATADQGFVLARSPVARVP